MAAHPSASWPLSPSPKPTPSSKKTIEAVERGERILLAAFVDSQLIGTVQILTATPPNQPHRADVAKLLVYRAARGKGFAALLMQHVEQESRSKPAKPPSGPRHRHRRRRRGNSTLRLGWTKSGGIIPNHALFPDGQTLRHNHLLERPILNPMLKLVIIIVPCARASCTAHDISRDLPYLSIDIRTAPVAPQTEGGYLLQYELFVTNWYDQSITIRAIDILAGDTLLKTLRGQAARWDIRRQRTEQTAIVGSRQTTTMILSAVINPLPAKLSTTEYTSRIAGSSQDTIVRYRGTPTHGNALHLQPPLRGDSLDRPCRTGRSQSSHRGRPSVRRTHAGSPSASPSASTVRMKTVKWCMAIERTSTATDVMAPKSLPSRMPEVIFTRNDVPDNPGNTKPSALPDSLENMGGNRVVLDLGSGN